MPDYRSCVNISARLFRLLIGLHDRVVEVVGAAVTRFLPLKLEITESALMDYAEASANDMAARLKHSGIQVGRSTTSAPDIRRSTISSASRSTRSRSIAPS